MKGSIFFKGLTFLHNHRLLLVLIFMVAGIAIPPFFHEKAGHRLISTLLFSFSILSGLYAFSQNTSFLKVSAVFFILAIIAAWINFFRTGNNIFEISRAAFFVAIYITLLVKTLVSINGAKDADLNVIFGSLVGYMLIGYLGGFSAVGISAGYPGSFNLPSPLSTSEGIYYSFVTMTTMGYGDIIPVGPQARALAILLSVIGPMYIAILISMLVSKYANKRNDQKPE